jgi:hypothetical protein
LKKYQAYHINVVWTEDFEDGTRRNSCTIERMPKEKTNKKKIEQDVLEWSKEFFEKNKDKFKNPRDVKLSIKYLGRLEWCPAWFSHWTWDTGQSDEELMTSFREYVYKHTYFSEENSVINGACLMGAKDIYRWRGGTDEDGTEHKAPCRCNGCKKAGVVRIQH